MGLSKDDRQCILADIKTSGFKVWPAPAEGQAYGPTAKQLDAFLVPHKHPQDVLLYYGGGRGGKTAQAVACGLTMAIETPGIAGMVGCEEYTHLEKSAMGDYKRLLSVHSDWDHPLVYRRPTSHRKMLQLINGSTIWFMHFSDFAILRGIELAFGHIEEASLLKDKAVFGEVQRRLSSNKVKCRRLMITSNPEESKGWLHETFNLQQFEPTYKGEPLPIGKPCTCQFCFNCAADSKQVPWVAGICLECGSKKSGSCPGNQNFWRVVMADPRDNNHLPQDYRETQRQSTTDLEFQLYTEGKVIELRSNKCYPNFKTENNVHDLTLNYSQPMYWNFDFNIAYQCSVVAQETEVDGKIHCDIIDELVVPNAGPQEVAKEWLRRYWAFDQPVYFIFDPSAFNNSIRQDDGGVRIKIIREILEHPEDHGYPNVKPKQCILLTKKIEQKTKVMVSARVDSVNKALDDRNGFHRIRISPKCIWTIRSLEDLKWTDNNGKPVIDTAVDKMAAKAIDKKTLRTLSHPTDALGYYVFKRFPVVGAKYSQMYALMPGEALVKTSADGQRVETISDVRKKLDMEETTKEKLKLVYNLDQQENDPTRQSLRGLLTEWGAFENDPDSSPFNQFWQG